MSDLTITHADVTAQVEGNNDAGVEFVDAWTGPMLEVIDSGIIVIPAEAMLNVERAAKHAGLSVETEEGVE